MATWQLQEAKAKFSQVVDVALKEGAQVVTRNGVPAVAIVPIEQWEKVAPAEAKEESALEWLKKLRAMPGGIDKDGYELVIPPRRKERERPIPEFD